LSLTYMLMSCLDHRLLLLVLVLVLDTKLIVLGLKVLALVLDHKVLLLVLVLDIQVLIL